VREIRQPCDHEYHSAGSRVERGNAIRVFSYSLSKSDDGCGANGEPVSEAGESGARLKLLVVICPAATEVAQIDIAAVVASLQCAYIRPT
jgi:hypothetical protein